MTTQKSKRHPDVTDRVDHGVEIVPKGSLSHRGKNHDELRAMGHDLIKLWKEFKGRAGDLDLNKFDEVISALNKFEAIRYPGAVVKSGMVVFGIDPNFFTGD